MFTYLFLTKKSRYLSYNVSGDKMSKYYLFMINDDFARLYHDKSDFLFIMLNDLYSLDKTHVEYGMSIFKQLCRPFNVPLINNYLKEKFESINIGKVHKIYKSKITVKYPCVIVEGDIIPAYFRFLNYYGKNIFVCEFNEKRYFWMNKVHSNEYI